MKLSPLYLLAALLVLAPALPGPSWAQGFEGTITTRQITVSEGALLEILYGEEEVEEEPSLDAESIFAIPLERVLSLAGSLSDEIRVSEITFSIKGTKMRMDRDDEEEMPGYALLDFAAGSFQLVQPSEMIYIEWTKEDFEELQAMMPAMEEGETTPSAQVRPLGVTKQINGMDCSAYEIKLEDATTIAWVTEELRDLVTAFREFETRMQGMGMFEEEDESTETYFLVAEHGFPVMEQTLTTYSMFGGVEYDVQEVVAVEREPLSASLFTVPSDYERRSFLDMMRMFMPERK
jgi:hypothetical protein